MKKRQETNEVPRRVRGSLLVRGDDSYEFTPYAEGESTQEVLKQSGKSKLYRTKGRQPLMVAYLTVPADAVDPRAAFLEQADELTEDMETKAKPKLRGMRLMNEDDLSVTFSKKERVIEATLRIELEKTPAYNNRLITLMQRVSQCFAINQTIFLKPKC